MHQKKVVFGGKKVSEAKKALILLHGRGASAQDILSLASHLNVMEYALVAPQATNHTWYPMSFMASPSHNEPWLSSALAVIDEIINDLIQQGIGKKDIYFLGFSQGACLTLEYTTRNADKWGGVVALTGGLIGDQVYMERYHGDFQGTPIYIGTSDPDPHVPVLRVKASEETLKKLHAHVVVDIFPHMGHTVSQTEIDQANRWVFKEQE